MGNFLISKMWLFISQLEEIINAQTLLFKTMHSMMVRMETTPFCLNNQHTQDSQAVLDFLTELLQSQTTYENSHFPPKKLHFQ